MSIEFAIDLYQKLGGKAGNVCFSPWSINQALTMTWAGARGATADEIAKALHLPSNADVLPQIEKQAAQLKADAIDSETQLTTVNALWSAPRFSVLPAYRRQMESTFGAYLSQLDFAADPAAARQRINGWIASQTHGDITDLLDPGNITFETRLLLTNAVLFKAAWEYPFEVNRTQQELFFFSAEQKGPVPLMYQQRSFNYAEDSTMQVVDLPYRHGQLLMRVFLPASRDQLDALGPNVTVQRVHALVSAMEPQLLQLWLPRFKSEEKYDLVAALSALGIKHAFSGADFSGMSTTEGLFVSDVVHQAFVDTHEKGTEAAAATAVEMRGGVLLPGPGSKIFRADHPFIFAIVHKPTGAILFMGRVVRP